MNPKSYRNNITRDADLEKRTKYYARQANIYEMLMLDYTIETTPMPLIPFMVSNETNICNIMRWQYRPRQRHLIAIERNSLPSFSK